MTAPVEARSLSSLTTLFANPPQYPRNPTHKALEPLVLYIVRVPGSRDIFLSPLKPPTKASISAEAIQSSLYYFHISTPEDEVVVKESLEEDRRSWSTEQDCRIDAIQRKPLPSSSFAEHSTSEELQPLPHSYSHSPRRVIRSEGDIQAGRYVESAKYVSLRSPHEGSAISRKPVGPRPIGSGLKTPDPGVIERKPVGGSGAYGSTGQRASTEFPPQIQSSDLFEGGRLRNSTGNTGTNDSLTAVLRSTPSVAFGHSQPPPALPSRPSYPSSEHEIGKDSRVTIIRRDPTSGSQWNIGSLEREQRPAPGDRDSLKIEITTPGYQKFARQAGCQAQNHQAFEQATGEHRCDSSPGNLSTATEKYASTPKASRPSSTHFTPMPFARDITLSKQPSHRPKSSHQHHRSSSSESFPALLSTPTVAISPKRPAQLTFSSPWNGTCTFTTGMDGRSLKCRHRLPSSTSEASDNSALVAELKFNLPWSALRSRDTNASASALAAGNRRPKSLALLGEDAKHSFKKGVARIRQEMNSTSSDTDVVKSSSALHPSSSESPSFCEYDHDSDDSSTSSTRLDLNLGRERAGGGRKGKSAKLGKLVLRDEGLKMADLVVAACMGVWWDVYCGK